MNDARWQRLWDLFHAALDEPPAARARFVAAASGDDAGLARDVSALLDAHVATRNPLDASPAARLSRDDPGLPAGAAIGRYRVVRPIGEGGMGRVYLVARDDGEYVQQAALKLLEPLLAQPRLVEGFLRERQILARLRHPRIARLLDGGRTPAGLPYLVMDYVDGLPIDRWCATRGATFAQRLRLFVDVCETVDFAHRHLVVHRDIKPGNVLVTPDGVPMLLDFGIAQTLGAGEHAPPAGDVQALTPRYAAPEQLEGAVVGTAADVYALGVLLYELVAGVAPYDTAGLGFAELARRVRTGAPTPVRVAARAHGTTTRLPPEIDWICRRALQAEPAARYRSAHALAADVEALLAHRPVAARTTSAGYRVRKFVRRRWPLVLAGALFVAMAGAFAWRVQTETQRTRVALAEARVARARAENVAAFLVALFREADTTQAGGRVVPAREILDRGRAELAARRDLPPPMRAMLLNALADVYRNMGATSTAADLLVEAQALLPQIDSPALEAETLANLGMVWELEGRHREARDVLTRALALRRAAAPPDRAAVATTAERLAVTLQSLGERAAAGNLFRETYAIVGDDAAADAARRADAALRLGSWHWVAGELDRAQALYGEALAARRAQQPIDWPELARTLDGVGSLLHARGRYRDAAGAFEEAIAIRRRVLGDAHRHTADSLSNLGACRFDAGDDAGAEPLLREALAIYARVLPPDSPVLAKTLNNLGLVRQRRHDTVEARALFERALAINRAAYGPTHARVAGNLNNLGLVAEEEDRLDDAAGAYAQALAIGEAALGPAHAQLGYALTNLARVRTFQRRGDEAEALFARARTIRGAALPADHPAQAETLTWYGHARCVAGDAVAGAAMLAQAQALREAVLAPDDPATIETRALAARCRLRAGIGADAAADAATIVAARRELARTRGPGARIVRLLNEAAEPPR